MIKILLSQRLGERRMTQSALARETHIRPATISHMYNEYFCENIKLSHLDSMCRVLGCNVADLITYIPDEEPNT